MVIYIISGYAWTNRIIMPLYLARYLHTALDIYMIPLFLAHALIGTKFTLKRHGVQQVQLNPNKNQQNQCLVVVDLHGHLYNLRLCLDEPHHNAAIFI
jgi:hypothetical protein